MDEEVSEGALLIELAFRLGMLYVLIRAAEKER